MTVTITGKANTYTNGNANDASQIEEDLNAFDGNFTAIKTKVDSLLSGNIEDATTLTVNSNYGGSSPSTVKIGVERGTQTNMWFQFEDTTNDRWEFTNHGTLYSPVMQRARQGCKPAFSSTSVYTIANGLFPDSTNKSYIEITGGLTVDITASGANGLDTGSEASNTWYYLWLCRGNSGVCGIFSTSSSSPTLPSGYNTYKALLPFAVRNDNSSNLADMKIGIGWPYSPEIYYNVNIGDNSAVGSNNVLNGGTQTSYTDVALSSYVPPISKQAIIKMEGVYSSGSSTSFFVRPNGESHDGQMLRITSANVAPFMQIPMPTDASQVIEYKLGANTSSGYIWASGFVVTEVP